MNVREKYCDGQSVFLFIFSGESCFRIKQMLYTGEEAKVEIGRGIPDLSEPVTVSLKRTGEGFLIDGKAVPESGYCFLKNSRNESVLLVPVLEKGTLDCCKKIHLKKEIITVGGGFGEDIFYEYVSFIKENAFLIYRERNRYCLESGEREKESKASTVYVNGRAVSGKVSLDTGDRIELMGLSMLFLKDMLLCTSFFGNLRITESNSFLIQEPGLHTLKKYPTEKGNYAEEIAIDTKALHQEEVELVLPEPQRREQVQPVLLTIGPSATMMLPVILMAALGSASEQGAYYLITVAMTAASAALSVFWGLTNHYYRRYAAGREEDKRKENYRSYLQSIREYLDKCREENREILLQRYPHYSSLFSEAPSVVKVCYARKGVGGRQELIRLGLGEVPFQIKIRMPAKRPEPLRDVLVQEAYELCTAYDRIGEVPVGIPFGQTMHIGFAGVNVFPLLLQFLLQLAAGYDGRELKMIYFYHQECVDEAKVAECIKWLPHLWQEGRKSRFLAGNEKEAGEILPVVESLLMKQGKEQQKYHYLLIVANPLLLENESIWEYLRRREEVPGITVCYAGREEEQLPANCRYLVLQEKGELLQRYETSVTRQQAMWEVCGYKEAERYMRSMAGFPTAGGSIGSISSRVSFLELYDCDRVEDLNCQGRWRAHGTRERMRVPIGMGEGGKKIYLDIHEKFHGPHGLVAGTTGAGKSELLQTYLLSLAVSFSPEDVSFFIIDYKGGGMGDVLAGLPHCSGIISNLSGRQIKRALVSIKSENLRRQSLLSKYKVSHIEEYKELYRDGEVPEPMPHLLLVVDEFAELKKEEPEFMQEIISVSQVGRSLGVHLILATQKPAGCVDDKIWSNTRFRLCLRVADKQDSTDMLHRPDAAFLTGAGKGYLQVGNDELFLLFQAGYCKAPYLPGSGMQADSALLSATGHRLCLQKEKDKKQKKQLDCIREYLQEIVGETACKSARELWMPELAETITLGEAVGDEQGICIGFCDDPKQQKQYPFFYRPERDGHLCLCGGPATGKSTFLQLILWQICTQNLPDEVQFLLATSDAAGVNCFEDMPHCLGSMKESRDAECFFYHLERFFHQRKALLEGISFAQYQKCQSKKIPILFLVIDNYGSFRRMTQDAYEELLEKLAAEGLNYGIYLVITALGAGGELPAKLFEKIKTTMTLELSDRVLYGDVLRRYRLDILPKEGCKGRGLCKVQGEILEMQIPLLSAQDDYGRIEEVREKAIFLQKQVKNGILKFPYIPRKADYEDLFARFQAESRLDKRALPLQLPLGYVQKSALIEMLTLKQDLPFVITGGAGNGKKCLLRSLLYGCGRLGIRAVVFDRKKELYTEGESPHTVISHTSEWAELKQSLKEDNTSSVVFAVVNLADFITAFPYEENMPPMLIVSRAEEELSLLGNAWYEWLQTKQRGICLGGNAGNQRLLVFEDLGYEHMSRSKPPGYGYLKRGPGKATRLLYLPGLSKDMARKGEDE